MSDERCETCQFGRELSNLSAECRRNAPVPFLGCRDGVIANWPTVDLNDWCGEWQPQEVRPATIVMEAEACRHDGAKAGSSGVSQLGVLPSSFVCLQCQQEIEPGSAPGEWRTKETA